MFAGTCEELSNITGRTDCESAAYTNEYV